MKVAHASSVQAGVIAALHHTDRLATLAHEVDDPLTVLLINLELIQADLDPLLADRALDLDTRANVRMSIDDARAGAMRIHELMRELKLVVHG